ncbi:unnamed protein product, partial [Citrullus colocynthis]
IMANIEEQLDLSRRMARSGGRQRMKLADLRSDLTSRPYMKEIGGIGSHDVGFERMNNPRLDLSTSR